MHRRKALAIAISVAVCGATASGAVIALTRAPVDAPTGRFSAAGAPGASDPSPPRTLVIDELVEPGLDDASPPTSDANSATERSPSGRSSPDQSIRDTEQGSASAPGQTNDATAPQLVGAAEPESPPRQQPTTNQPSSPAGPAPAKAVGQSTVTAAPTPAPAPTRTTSPPAPPTTAAVAPTTTRPPGVPADWPANKPIPPMPPGCRQPQLEDNGVWNCQH